jgi:hypothetical protein
MEKISVSYNAFYSHWTAFRIKSLLNYFYENPFTSDNYIHHCIYISRLHLCTKRRYCCLLCI